MSYVIRASSMISNCLHSRVYSGVEHTERRAPKADETDVDGAELTPQLKAVLTLSVPSMHLSSLKEMQSPIKRRISNLEVNPEQAAAGVKQKWKMSTAAEGWGVSPNSSHFLRATSAAFLGDPGSRGNHSGSLSAQGCTTAEDKQNPKPQTEQGALWTDRAKAKPFAGLNSDKERKQSLKRNIQETWKGVTKGRGGGWQVMCGVFGWVPARSDPSMKSPGKHEEPSVGSCAGPTARQGQGRLQNRAGVQGTETSRD